MAKKVNENAEAKINLAYANAMNGAITKKKQTTKKKVKKSK